MVVRAGIVVTGTEVLTGRVADANGPWLAQQLLELGVEPVHITLCGDRPEDMAGQLRFLADAGMDLIITSGGLGPTADDLTVAVVADFCGLAVHLDIALEQRIADILRPMWRQRSAGVDFDAVLAANRKQALVPAGARVLDPVGTAPGLVIPGTPTVVVLPGPPRELQPMWRKAVADDALAQAISGRTILRQDTVRMYGVAESALAQTLRDAEPQIIGFDQLEITTCLRRGEVEIVTRYPDEAHAAYQQLVASLIGAHGSAVFSTDGALIDQQVAAALAGRTIATAESCTGGMLAARLTDLAGSSAYVAGAVVSYANEVKSAVLGVDPELIAVHGAVSEEVARAMAAGALQCLNADTAVAITGVAGPGGGTEDKPVGTVWFCVQLSDGTSVTRRVRLPGERADVRERATTVAMHLLRTTLAS